MQTYQSLREESNLVTRCRKPRPEIRQDGESCALEESNPFAPLRRQPPGSARSKRVESGEGVAPSITVLRTAL